MTTAALLIKLISLRLQVCDYLIFTDLRNRVFLLSLIDIFPTHLIFFMSYAFVFYESVVFVSTLFFLEWKKLVLTAAKDTL